VVVVQVGDQHRVQLSPHLWRGGWSLAAQGPDPPAQHRIGEQTGAAELGEDGRVTDIGDPVCRRHVRESSCVKERDIEIEPGELSGIFAAPKWMRDLGFSSWLLVGFGAALVGTVWLLSLTQTIVLPVIGLRHEADRDRGQLRTG